jgi:hypothetical protein
MELAGPWRANRWPAIFTALNPAFAAPRSPRVPLGRLAPAQRHTAGVNAPARVRGVPRPGAPVAPGRQGRRGSPSVGPAPESGRDGGSPATLRCGRRSTIFRPRRPAADNSNKRGARRAAPSAPACWRRPVGAGQAEPAAAAGRVPRPAAAWVAASGCAGPSFLPPSRRSVARFRVVRAASCRTYHPKPGVPGDANWPYEPEALWWPARAPVMVDRYAHQGPPNDPLSSGEGRTRPVRPVSPAAGACRQARQGRHRRFTGGGRCPPARRPRRGRPGGPGLAARPGS